MRQIAFKNREMTVMKIIFIAFSISLFLFSNQIAIAQFAGGSGTEEDPYQISTIEQLQDIRNYLDRNFIQINDIDAGITKSWNDSLGFKPIGDNDIPFLGTYNGNDKSISNLYINRPHQDNIGIFGIVNDGTIKNIKIETPKIIGKNNISTVVGNLIKGTISQINVKDASITGIRGVGIISGRNNDIINHVIVSGLINGENQIGGITGYNLGIIENSKSNIISKDSLNIKYVGGIAGGNSGKIIEAESVVDIFGEDILGGIAGSNSGTIQESTSTGLIKVFMGYEASVTNSGVGGIAGENRNEILNSSSSVHLEGTLNVGGLVGRSGTMQSTGGLIQDSFSTGTIKGVSQVGGLVGLQFGGKVINSYSIGNVDGEKFTGGLIGNMLGSYVENSYSESDVNGIEDNIGGLIGISQQSVSFFGPDSEIIDSYATGNVKSNGKRVGGLIGSCSGTVSNSYSNSNVEGDTGVGGLIGSGCSNIENSQSIGNIIGDTYVGGLVGSTGANIVKSSFSGSVLGMGDAIGGLVGLSSSSIVESSVFASIKGRNEVGGFIGENSGNIVDSYHYGNVEGNNVVGNFIGNNKSSANISTSYTVGNVVGADTLGGFIGYNGGRISKSYWNPDSSGVDNGIGFGIYDKLSELNTSQMVLDAPLIYMKGFDFTSVWKLTTGFPALRWEDYDELPGLPEIPLLLVPENKEVIQSLNPTIRWNASERAEYYQLQVSKNKDFSNLVYDVNELKQTHYNLEDLAYNTNYYWRVKAYNIGGESDWTDTWEFFTEYALEQAVAQSPAHKEEEVSIPLTFEWKPVEGAANYELQLSKDADFEHLIDYQIADKSKKSKSANNPIDGKWSVSVTVDNLDFETQYYWRVRAINGDLYSDWNEPAWFTTQKAPISGQVTLLAPQNNANDVNFPVNLSWEAFEQADFYELQLAESPSFDTTMTANKLTNTEFTIPTFTDTTTFYWRVRASVEEQLTAWSETWSYTTALSLPEIPTWSPNNGEENVSTSPNLVWAPSKRAESYQLQVSKAEDFQETVIDVGNIEQTEYQIEELDGETTYYWRVQAVNAVGVSGWSDVRTFRTESPTSNELVKELPNEFVLQQNYPNPFNPTTNITYGIPEASDVRLEVFNMLGQKVTTLVNGKQSAGWHTISFDARGLSSGFYVYRIQAGEFVATKKLMLMK